MTDRLGSSGPDPRSGRVNGVQAPQTVQPLGLPTGFQAGRTVRGPQFSRDGLQISEDTRAYYAALVSGETQPGTDPEVALRLALVHGPNSDLFQAVRGNPVAQPQPSAPPILPPEAEPTAMGTFFSRTFREMSFAWQDFTNTQAW